MRALIAVVLTGGRSRRMGTPKAWAEVGGRTCLARVVDACRGADLDVEFQGELAGLAAAFPGTPVHADAAPGEGPLAALAAALARHPGEPLLLLACDLPLLPPSLLRALREGLPGADWVVPLHAERLHPLCGGYGPGALRVATALLGQGRRDMHALLADATLVGRPLAPLPAWGDPEAALLNVNTPEDLAEARRRGGAAPLPRP